MEKTMFDFSKNAKVASLDAVPEQFRLFYKQTDDGFALDLETPVVKTAVEVISGMSKALGAARTEAAEAKRGRVDLAPLSEFGATPEEIAAAVRDRLTAAAGAPKADIEKVKADLAKAHASETEKYSARTKALESQLYQLLVENAARAAIAEHKGDADLLMPFVRERVVVREDGGKFSVVVVDEGKNIRYSGVTGQEMNIKDLVGEMKSQPRYGRLFDSGAPAGGGTPPAAPGGRPAPQGGPDNRTSTQKIADGLRKGLVSKA